MKPKVLKRFAAGPLGFGARWCNDHAARPVRAPRQRERLSCQAPEIACRVRSRRGPGIHAGRPEYLGAQIVAEPGKKDLVEIEAAECPTAKSLVAEPLDDRIRR